MLRTFAVALLAASVFTAPVFAQGSGAAATPPVKTETRSNTATPKVVTAQPTLKSAKVKTSKRYAHRPVKHVRHVAHVKPVRHVAHVKPVWHVAHAKPVWHVAHVKPVKHVAHVKRVKHVTTPHVAHGIKAHTQVRHVVNKTTIGQNGATPAPKAKSNVN
jgi:hypothetical protein